MTISHWRHAPALITAVVVAACTSTHRGAVQTTPEPAARQEISPPAIAKARADSLRHPYTVADVDFMSHMIGHHAQALVMAGWAPSHGANPSVRILAERIINAQQDEIATMQQWLRDRGKPVPDPKAAGMKMMMNGVEQEMLMPGMLTQDQMKQLDQSRGPDFDRRFLTFMIQHHRGAVAMVQSLFGTNAAAQDETVFKFANDASVDQSTEIARMERMLAALPASNGSP
jgi:uncharacterized protein (DUF305 family)